MSIRGKYMKQYIIALGLGMVLFLGGCGSQQAIDTYSFGQKVINVGQSEVIVDSPFDFGQLDRIVANEKGQPLTIYAGLDKNYGVYVSATQASTGAPLPTLEEGTKLAQQELAKELGQASAKAQWTQEAVQVDGVNAVKSSMTAGSNGQTIRFTQYTFINKGVLWNIRYSYSDQSPQGEDINQRVNGHIQVTKKEG